MTYQLLIIPFILVILWIILICIPYGFVNKYPVPPDSIISLLPIKEEEKTYNEMIIVVVAPSLLSINHQLKGLRRVLYDFVRLKFTVQSSNRTVLQYVVLREHRV